MSLEIVDGDLLLAQDDYICHQCNCMSKRAAHLALSVFGAFPFADVYSARQNPDEPGTIKVCTDGGKRIVALFGQVYPGRPRYETGIDCATAREGYFERCLSHLDTEVKAGSIAFPWGIGCGAAGGCWPNYLAMIEKFASRDNLTVHIYRKG